MYTFACRLSHCRLFRYDGSKATIHLAEKDR